MCLSKTSLVGSKQGISIVIKKCSKVVNKGRLGSKKCSIKVN